MKRPRIITRRVALSYRFSADWGGWVVVPLSAAVCGTLLLPPLCCPSYVRTRVRVCARPTGAGARVYSLGPLSGNS